MSLTIESLRDEQDTGVTDLKSTLRSVEINPVELCNRACSFCPRSDPELYSNNNNRISAVTCHNIARGLNDIDYTGRIGFVGFGEPLMHKDLSNCVNIMKQGVPGAQWIEVNTNGDLLTRKKATQLAQSGCNVLCVSMYDTDISDKVHDICTGLDMQVICRHHYDQNDYKLKIVDRKNIINSLKAYDYNKSCNIPFYHMLIDWNGDVLLCNNDWSKSVVFGNVNDEHIIDIWLNEKFMKHREKLLNGRCGLSPCSKCNVNGSMYGDDSVRVMKESIM